jgi:tRNA threonylcarbamoyladenosine biosynthesis protein TsaB
MLVLATDTSGKQGSIALAEGEADGTCRVLELRPLAGGMFSAELVPQIALLLARHGFIRQDIAAFAVASGPGSFTGLRVGLAAIKALGEVLGKPIAAISLLEAVATAGSSEGRVLAALDAGRSQVYGGEYHVGKLTRPVGERLLTLEEFLAAAATCRVITPDAGIARAARDQGLAIEEIERPTSAAIARLGWRKIQARETVSPADLEANYIRRTDAEIFHKNP